MEQYKKISQQKATPPKKIGGISFQAVKISFDKALYKVEECGNTTFCTTSHIGKQSILVLPEREYIVLETGEVKQMKEKAETRGENIRYLKNSLARLSKLIDFNIPKYSATLNFTLTYAENMTDTKRLYKDWKKFYMRLVYRFGSDACTDYIIACEPQARGAWHIHCILFQRVKTFIHWQDLKEIWGFGMIDVDKRNDDLDSVGKYLTAYLSDVRLDELQDFKQGATEDQKKALKDFAKNGVINIDHKGEHQILKGVRMLFYPAGFHFFRWSKGIKQPTETKRTLTKQQALENFGHCVSATHWEVESEKGTITTERFVFKKKVNPKFKDLILEI